MSALVTLSIFGNIFVMTITASRVEQETAKEGILPFFVFFATNRKTPDEWLRQRFTRRSDRLASSYQLSQYTASHPPTNTDDGEFFN